MAHHTNEAIGLVYLENVKSLYVLSICLVPGSGLHRDVLFWNTAKWLQLTVAHKILGRLSSLVPAYLYDELINAINK
jgi:hypothetical protein